MSGRQGGSERVRYFGGDREDLLEEESEVYDNTDRVRFVQRAIIIQRGSFRACAVCVTVLCVLLAAGIIGISMYYNSTTTELQAKYDNLTLERDQWKTSFDNLTLERDQWKTSYENLLTLEIDRLQRKVIQLERAVKSCPSGWMKFGDSCYYKSAAVKTWRAHRELCLKTGADLVIINSQEEQEFIRGLTTEDQYGSWIGLKRTAGKWTWVDGTPLITQYWSSGWPRNDDDCGLIHKVGGWASALCSWKAHLLCEK